jgi:hypothetical protein
MGKEASAVMCATLPMEHAVWAQMEVCEPITAATLVQQDYRILRMVQLRSMPGTVLILLPQTAVHALRWMWMAAWMKTAIGARMAG